MITSSISPSSQDHSKYIPKKYSLSKIRRLPRKEYEFEGYSLIDLEQAKSKALSALNLNEYQMWCQIERGEL